MKLIYIIPLFIAAAGLFSCNDQRTPNRHENSEVAQDTLSYKYQTVEQRAGDCGSKPDSACTSAIFKLPVFENQPALNDTINHRLAYLFDSTATNAKAEADKFIKQYNTDKQKGAVRQNAFYTLKSHADIIRQDSTLLTLELNGYEFESGAHGLSLTKFINWDIKNHKVLTMDEVFVDGYLPKLNQIADTIFRKEENLSLAASLANDYFFKNAEFSLNKNFLITPLGIRFLYNVYEIKPYAAGQTSIDIPYTKISKLLRPNSVAAIYSK